MVDSASESGIQMLLTNLTQLIQGVMSSSKDLLCILRWAGESDPRLTFRNVVQRPRHKATGETVTIIGDQDPMLMKYFDCTRSSYKSPFDSNVVYQFEIMEYVLDFGFERMGASDSQVDHPILMTECACNPLQSRTKMAELLFETYGVPSVAFGIDAVFSYKHNQMLGVCGKDGLVVCSGFNTSHVIPVVNREPVIEACCRTNIGGFHITDYMRQLLILKYPNHLSSLTWEKVEDLKMEHCYIALDYTSELNLFQKGTQDAEEKIRCWQLPWVPPPQGESPSKEELARRAALKEKQGQRLREMAAAKRSSRITELETQVHDLEFLLQQLDKVPEHETKLFLSETGYISRQEIESFLSKLTQSLRKARGESAEVDDKKEPPSEKYPLLSVPDNMLTPEQVKEKKKQQFLKTTTEGRQRAKQKRFEDELLRERQNQEDEERRIENPELYLDQLRTRYKELADKVGHRKRLKTNGARSVGYQMASSGTGRGERLNASQKERMRLLTTAAFDRGKGEDTFGSKDEDWQLYKIMSKDNDDDDDDGLNEDEADLTRIASKLQEIDPTFLADMGLCQVAPELVVPSRPLTEEDFQIILGVERFRCPEMLFQPNMVGIDQAGLDEMVGIAIRRLPIKGDAIDRRITRSILMTGGSCLFPGMCARLEAEVRKIRPFKSLIQVARAADPVLDAWRGAASYASSVQFPSQTFSRQDYYEKGVRCGVFSGSSDNGAGSKGYSWASKTF